MGNTYRRNSDGIVELVKNDGDGIETHVIANESGLAKAETDGQALDVSALVAEVVKMLDVPAMIEQAVVEVRKQLDIVSIDPADIARIYTDALAEV